MDRNFDSIDLLFIGLISFYFFVLLVLIYFTLKAHEKKKNIVVKNNEEIMANTNFKKIGFFKKIILYLQEPCVIYRPKKKETISEPTTLKNKKIVLNDKNDNTPITNNYKSDEDLRNTSTKKERKQETPIKEISNSKIKNNKKKNISKTHKKKRKTKKRKKINQKKKR